MIAGRCSKLLGQMGRIQLHAGWIRGPHGTAQEQSQFSTISRLSIKDLAIFELITTAAPKTTFVQLFLQLFST